MFFRCDRLVRAATWVVNPRACYKNFVNSDALALLDSQCEKCCYTPRIPEQKVTIIGAGSDIGQITSLILKQQKLIKTVAMYEEFPERGVLGVAKDIAHIDTSTEIEAYQGRAFLKAALDKADVVLLCGGSCAAPHSCDLLDRDLFHLNMNMVRSSTQAVAHFAPHVIFAVQTPPLDYNFPFAMHILKRFRVYDKHRLLGVNTITAMRASQMYCASSGGNPCQTRVPAVGGTGRCTRVPVFSGSNANADTACLTRLVREADDIVYRIKCNNGQAHLSIGFACARTVLSIMAGILGKPTDLDSALVEQDDPEMCYGMPICATPVTMGPSGIETYKIPKLNEAEKNMLENMKLDMEDMVNYARCCAVGDDYYWSPSWIKFQEYTDCPSIHDYADRE